MRERGWRFLGEWLSPLLCLPALVMAVLCPAPARRRKEQLQPPVRPAQASAPMPTCMPVGEFDCARAIPAYEALIDALRKESAR